MSLGSTVRTGGLPGGRRAPASAWVLSATGLIPFAASAAAYAFGGEALSEAGLRGLLPYAASILSFLGGVRWGAEIVAEADPRWTTMFGSVLPALVGWALIAVPFPTPEWPLGCFIAALIGCWLWDFATDDLPAWYKPLRTAVTLGAVACLALALQHAIRTG